MCNFCPFITSSFSKAKVTYRTTASDFFSSAETFEEGCPAKAIRERIQVLNVPELKQLVLQITSQMVRTRIFLNM